MRARSMSANVIGRKMRRGLDHSPSKVEAQLLLCCHDKNAVPFWRLANR